MSYSPVRHSYPKICVRLACIRHAASVHPEPGSNSPLSSIQRHLCLIDSLFFFSLLTCFCSVFNVPLLSCRVLIYNTIFISSCKVFFLFFSYFLSCFLFFPLSIAIFRFSWFKKRWRSFLGSPIHSPDILAAALFTMQKQETASTDTF